MVHPGRTVFLSYRRETSWAMAHLVRNDLVEHGFDVFLDVRGLDSGEFERVILREIETRKHFLALLEPRSLDRIADDGDWLRREIVHALAHHRNVVPLLANGARMPRAAELPADLARLPAFNAVSVPHDYFSEAMQKLRERFLCTSVRVTAESDPGERRRRSVPYAELRRRHQLAVGRKPVSAEGEARTPAPASAQPVRPGATPPEPADAELAPEPARRQLESRPPLVALRRRLLWNELRWSEVKDVDVYAVQYSPNPEEVEFEDVYLGESLSFRHAVWQKPAYYRVAAEFPDGRWTGWGRTVSA